MISKELEKVLNELIKIENNSASLYLAMANYFRRLRLDGISHWLMEQYKEETSHKLKDIDYLNKREGTVTILDVPEQENFFGTPLEAFRKVYSHEQAVTAAYNAAYKLALDENDVSAQSFLQGMIDEQIEEEHQSLVIVDKLRLAQEDIAALILIDGELGKR